MHNVNSLLILLAFGIAPLLQLGSLLLLAGSLAFLGFLALPKLSQFWLECWASSQITITYQQHSRAFFISNSDSFWTIERRYPPCAPQTSN